MMRPAGDRPDLERLPGKGGTRFRRLYSLLHSIGGVPRVTTPTKPVPPNSGPAEMTLYPHNGGPTRQEILSSSASLDAARDRRTELFERLSLAGQDALNAAQEEASALGHRSVGTEHLLLALTRQSESGACKVMERMGVNPARVRADVLNAVVPGAGPTSGVLAFTPRARLAVELAHRAAARIDVSQTGTEHLLIGLAAEAEGIAAKALHKSGIVLRTAENQVTADLDGNTQLP
jgi:hypothetical protein